MWKILRHGVSVICLLISAVAICLWIRSLYIGLVILVPMSSVTPEYGLVAAYAEGHVFLNCEESHIFPRMASWTFISAPIPATSDEATRFRTRISNRQGFQFAGFGASVVAGEFIVLIPIWQIVLASLLLPIADAILVMRQRGKASANRCPECHYDLRASTATCPECGTPINRPIDKLPA